jgi:glucokinase
MGNFAIVADIGGTNARFCRVDLTSLQMDNVVVYPCADFASLSLALNYYRTEQQLQYISDVAVAIACPVQGDVIKMTNFHWEFSIQAVKAELGLRHFVVLNDFTAVAMSLPALNAHELVKVGPGDAVLDAPRAVLGAGTGLGVGHLITTAHGYIPLPGEGGHTDWAATNEQEWFIQRYLAAHYGHVSPERLLSGPGLEALYVAIAAYKEQTVTPLSAAAIGQYALDGSDAIATAAVEQFFASLGSLAGDLALNLSTRGGVYVAGGIVPRLLSLVQDSEFRRRFELKGRFSGFTHAIPTFIVTAEQPGLLGCAVYLKQTLAG